MDNAGGDHPPDRFKPLDGGDRLVIVNGKPASRRRLQIAIPMMPVPIQPTRRTSCRVSNTCSVMDNECLGRWPPRVSRPALREGGRRCSIGHLSRAVKSQGITASANVPFPLVTR